MQKSFAILHFEITSIFKANLYWSFEILFVKNLVFFLYNYLKATENSYRPEDFPLKIKNSMLLFLVT